MLLNNLKAVVEKNNEFDYYMLYLNSESMNNHLINDREIFISWEDDRSGYLQFKNSKHKGIIRFIIDDEMEIPEIERYDYISAFTDFNISCIEEIQRNGGLKINNTFIGHPDDNNIEEE